VKVLGLEEVGHVLGLGVQVDGVVVVVAVAVAIVLGTDVLHLVDGSALHAAGLGLLARESDPENVVRVGREAGATGVLLLTGRVDDDGVLHGTDAAGIQRLHVEDIDTLHLSENFEALETGRLLGIGGNGTRLRTRGQKVVVRLDLVKLLEAVEDAGGGVGVLVVAAHNRRGEGAAGDGAGGHTPGRDNSGALEKHGESNRFYMRLII
jgi:hypothetical protein